MDLWSYRDRGGSYGVMELWGYGSILVYSILVYSILVVSCFM